MDIAPILSDGGCDTGGPSIEVPQHGIAAATYVPLTTRSEPTPPWTSISTRFGAVE